MGYVPTVKNQRIQREENSQIEQLQRGKLDLDLHKRWFTLCLEVERTHTTSYVLNIPKPNDLLSSWWKISGNTDDSDSTWEREKMSHHSGAISWTVMGGDGDGDGDGDDDDDDDDEGEGDYVVWSR